LWDAHEEADDPRDERILARGRQTLSTSAIDARPVAITEGERESVLPLVLALAVGAAFAAVVARALPVALVFVIVCVAVTAAWLRPQRAS
jgi:hypothetical protein